MSRYPARTPVDPEALLRGLNMILKAADETGTGRQAVISASIRFLGEQGGIGLDMWSADLDPAHLLERKVGDIMRAAARVSLSHEFPVPIIKRYVQPIQKLLDMDEDIEKPEFESPRPPRMV